MKNKIKKDIYKKVNTLFLQIKTNKFLSFLLKRNIFIRMIISFVFILFALIAYIIPPIPFATIALIIGLSMFFPLKSIKSKLLYILNITRIKKLFIYCYMEVVYIKRWK